MLHVGDTILCNLSQYRGRCSIPDVHVMNPDSDPGLLQNTEQEPCTEEL